MADVVDANNVIAMANAVSVTPVLARRALSCLDLTSLNDERDDDVRTLCEKARLHEVAAVCVWPEFVPACVEALAGTSIAIATVINFPHGGGDIQSAVDEAVSAVRDGATELDLVIPVEAALEGDIELVSDMVRAVIDAVDPSIRHKIILETAVLESPHIITGAARSAIMAGCHMIKTSTGKRGGGATPEAAAICLSACHESDGRVGFKASGGVRTAEDAVFYLSLADAILGDGWAQPETFRIGASSVLGPLADAAR